MTVLVELVTGAVDPWDDYVKYRAPSSRYLRIEGLSSKTAIKQRHSENSKNNWFDAALRSDDMQRLIIFTKWGAWSTQDGETIVGKEWQAIVLSVDDRVDPTYFLC